MVERSALLRNKRKKELKFYIINIYDNKTMYFYKLCESKTSNQFIYLINCIKSNQIVYFQPNHIKSLLIFDRK